MSHPTCMHCPSIRIVKMGGKVRDQFWCSGVTKEGKEWNYEGYVPDVFSDPASFGGGDYFGIDFCLDCGKVQEKFPVRVLSLESKGIPSENEEEESSKEEDSSEEKNSDEEEKDRTLPSSPEK